MLPRSFFSEHRLSRLEQFWLFGFSLTGTILAVSNFAGIIYYLLSTWQPGTVGLLIVASILNCCIFAFSLETMRVGRSPARDKWQSQLVFCGGGFALLFLASNVGLPWIYPIVQLFFGGAAVIYGALTLIRPKNERRPKI